MIILLIFSFFFQETITLKKTNLNITLELSGKINNSEKRPFYHHTKSHFYKDFYYVIDGGNKKLYKLNSSFEDEKVLSFFGNGPGENQYTASTVFFADEKIFLGFHNKISIYDLNLVHLKDISLLRTMKTGASYRYNDKLIIEHVSAFKDAFTVMTFDGTVLFEKANPNYQEGIRGGSLNFAFPFHEFDKFLVKAREGDYRIDFYDEKLDKLKSISRNFERIRNPYFEIQREKNKKRQAFAKSKGMAFESDLSEYNSDISWTIGIYKSYLFIITENEDTTILPIEIINLETMEYDQIELNHNWKYNRIWSLSISENKLLIDYANEDDGPVVSIYEIIEKN